MPFDAPTFKIARDKARGLTARPSIIRSWRQRTTGFANAATGTYNLTAALEAPWDLVRLVYANDQTGATTALTRACIAPSAKYNDGFNPLTAAGAAVPWIPVTCNNGGADVLYGQQATGSTEGMTIAVATAADNPTLACTDWMVASSLDRADAGETLPLLMIRTYLAATARQPARVLNDFILNWPTVNQGRIIKSWSKAGDFVTTPAGFTSPGATDLIPVYGVQTYQRGRGFNVMTLGDSLTEGYQTVANMNGFGFQACAAISALGRPVACVNSGWQGQTPTQYIARGYREFDLFRPDVVIIETSSPNGTTASQADLDFAFSLALGLAEYVERAGKIAVLKTAVPWTLYNATQDGFRQVINAQVRAIGTAGQMLILDADAAVTDGATPARVQAQWLAADGNHINDAGHGVIATAALPVLARALSR